MSLCQAKKYAIHIYYICTHRISHCQSALYLRVYMINIKQFPTARGPTPGSRVYTSFFLFAPHVPPPSEVPRLVCFLSLQKQYLVKKVQEQHIGTSTTSYWSLSFPPTSHLEPFNTMAVRAQVGPFIHLLPHSASARKERTSCRRQLTRR